MGSVIKTARPAVNPGRQDCIKDGPARPPALMPAHRSLWIDPGLYRKRRVTRLSCSVFTDPAITPDEYLGQFEATATDLLDRVAPLRYGTRPGGRTVGKQQNG
jgi:hypothetical protein